MFSNFLLGTLRVDSEVRDMLGRVPLDLIARHAINEHGCLTASEAKKNLRGMKDCGQIMSRYVADPTDPNSPHVLVVTSDNWTETTVTLENHT